MKVVIRKQWRICTVATLIFCDAYAGTGNQTMRDTLRDHSEYRHEADLFLDLGRQWNWNIRQIPGLDSNTLKPHRQPHPTHVAEENVNARRMLIGFATAEQENSMAHPVKVHRKKPVVFDGEFR